MYRSTLILIFFATFSYSQNAKKLQIDQQISDCIITQNQDKVISLSLKKDIYYHINVLQKGIDVELILKNNKGTKVAYKDSPNGKNGLETFVFSPNETNNFNLIIKRLEEDGNPKKGKVDIQYTKVSDKLTQFSYSQLIEDFDILKNAYFETKVGLWYANYHEFDSICNLQKSKLKDGMNSLEFYKIMAPITAYTNEGHSAVRNSKEVNNHRKQFGKHFPYVVKILNDKVYFINDGNLNGFELKTINNTKIENILEKFYSIEPSDGYNETSKNHWIAKAFSKYYYLFFEQHPKEFKLELANPTSKESLTYVTKAISYKELLKNIDKTYRDFPQLTFKKPIDLTINTKDNYALLTVNSFWKKLYKRNNINFEKFLNKSFDSISKLNIKNLIIDIRKNEGGEQGMEDILLSYLITKPYKKYNYVEVPSYKYTFLPYTRYDLPEEVNILKERTLKKFYKTKDGRYLNKPKYYNGLTPVKNPFKGNVYILIGGLSFSGGSEFAALAKNHTKAIFVGEETGGGYYGNTSGNYMHFTLPNTKTTGRIPLEKFIVNCKEFNIPFGHGLLPDHEVQPTIQQFLNNENAELNFVKKLIHKKNKGVE